MTVLTDDQLRWHIKKHLPNLDRNQLLALVFDLNAITSGVETTGDRLNKLRVENQALQKEVDEMAENYHQCQRQLRLYEKRSLSTIGR